MSKITFHRATTKRIQRVAPNLKFVAFYHAQEGRLNACMRDYADRAFVYILSSIYEGEEYFLYAGKSKAQYARCLTHSKQYAYDHIYLFECTDAFLAESEAAVITELCPLFNRKHNPIAGKLNRILRIDYTAKQDVCRIHQYLERYAEYKNTGLFGFALPVSVFAALEKRAGEENCTCSEMLQTILESILEAGIVDQLDNAGTLSKTNLITTKTYGRQNGKSPEQIKQYLHQKNRLPGTAKIGRDWVLPQDTRFPKDLRGKSENKDDVHLHSSLSTKQEK